MKSLFKLFLVLGVVFCLLFGLPFIGVLVAFELAAALGCKLSSAGPSECLLIGFDIGERLYGYTIPIVGTILTPIVLFSSFWDILIMWTCLCVLLGLKSKIGIKSK